MDETCDGCNSIMNVQAFKKAVACGCDVCNAFVLCDSCHEYFSEIRKAKL